MTKYLNVKNVSTILLPPYYHHLNYCSIKKCPCGHGLRTRNITISIQSMGPVPTVSTRDRLSKAI